MAGKRIPNLHRPIEMEIGGQTVTLLTVGHVAKALGRTTATIKWWEGIGLFPRAPLRLYPDLPAANRRLYPSEFVRALRQMNFDYLGTRLDHRDFQRFHDEVVEVFEEAMAPIRELGWSAGATEPTEPD